MKLGLRLPQRAGFDLRRDVAAVARGAEELGYASLWTYERVLFPDSPAEDYFGSPWPEPQRQAADPLAVLAAAAMVTTTPRLGTGVLIAPAHAPFQLAKSLATIDQLSGGRLVAGLGAGWSSDELQTVRATRADRGRFLDETLDVFAAVWGPDPVSYTGPRTIIDKAAVLPKPAAEIPCCWPAALRAAGPWNGSQPGPTDGFPSSVRASSRRPPGPGTGSGRRLPLPAATPAAWS